MSKGIPQVFLLKLFQCNSSLQLLSFEAGSSSASQVSRPRASTCFRSEIPKPTTTGSSAPSLDSDETVGAERRRFDRRIELTHLSTGAGVEDPNTQTRPV